MNYSELFVTERIPNENSTLNISQKIGTKLKALRLKIENNQDRTINFGTRTAS